MWYDCRETIPFWAAHAKASCQWSISIWLMHLHLEYNPWFWAPHFPQRYWQIRVFKEQQQSDHVPGGSEWGKTRRNCWIYVYDMLTMFKRLLRLQSQALKLGNARIKLSCATLFWLMCVFIFAQSLSAWLHILFSTGPASFSEQDGW